MKKAEKKLLIAIKAVAKERTIDPTLPARCFSVYHQPKRPKK